jgi:hypothetical protein
LFDSDSAAFLELGDFLENQQPLGGPGWHLAINLLQEFAVIGSFCLLLLAFVVHKLAPGSIRAVELLVVLLAEARLVLGGHVQLLLELRLPMGEGAAVPEAAIVRQLPISAHLSTKMIHSLPLPQFYTSL